MAKITLGKRPTDFKHTVEIPVPGSDTPDTLELTFVYRTRTELAKFTDDYNAKAKARMDALWEKYKPKEPEKGRKAKAAASETLPVVKPTMPSDEELAATLNESFVDYVMGACFGWELSDEFNRKNVLQLVDRFPGCVSVIADTYARAIKDGRLGN